MIQDCVEGIKVLDENICMAAYKTSFQPYYLRRHKVFEPPHTIYEQCLASCEFLLFPKLHEALSGVILMSI